ncbi:MAG: HAD family hydrolase [Gemmatimonadota bacterium]
MTAGGRPAVFVDRDGTLIEDRHYLSDPDEVSLLPGAAAAVARLNRAGLPVVVVTNQSGLARGFFDEAAYHAVAGRLDELLQEHGARLDASYHCPHGPDTSPPCPCRKPASGLFERAAREHGLDLGRSYFIGDRLRDVVPGVILGGTGFLLPGEDEPIASDGSGRLTRVASLDEAVDRLLNAERRD